MSIRKPGNSPFALPDRLVRGKLVRIAGETADRLIHIRHYGVGITAVVWFEYGLSVELESIEVAT